MRKLISAPLAANLLLAALGLLAVFHVLNVIGNLTSQSHVEKMIFTPVAIVISVLAFRLAIEK
jgi:hypothetical protein